MSKDVIEQKGVVVEALPNASFRVKINATEQLVLCHVSGKIRVNHIRIMPGDNVIAEFSPYNLEKGRITKRV